MIEENVSESIRVGQKRIKSTFGQSIESLVGRSEKCERFEIFKSARQPCGLDGIKESAQFRIVLDLLHNRLCSSVAVSVVIICTVHHQSGGQKKGSCKEKGSFVA